MHQCNFWIVIKKKKKKKRERDCSKFLTILFLGKKIQNYLEPAPYTGAGDDSDDNYEDCDWGGDDFDDNDGAVAGADWNTGRGKPHKIVPFLLFYSIF